MATDPVTTSLTGLGVGALGVLVMAALNWNVFTKRAVTDAADEKQPLLVGMFFTFLLGFLFAWVLGYASGALSWTGGTGGALFGGLVWVAFVLPTDLTHVAWEERTLPRHVRALCAWLVQLIVGGAVAGAVLLA